MTADVPAMRGPKAAPVGRPRKLSAEAIVNAALEIADESGAERVSIRALATRLGVQATAIYTNFENLEAIEAAVIEKLLAGVPVIDAESAVPLRQQLIEHFVALRDAHIAHPRIGTGRIGSPAWKRNALHLNAILKQLAARGVDMATVEIAYSALSGVTVMAAMLVNAYRNEDPKTAPQRAFAALTSIQADQVLRMMSLLASERSADEHFRQLLGDLIDKLLPRSVARAGKAGRRRGA